MAQNISIDAKTAEKILSRLEQLSEDMKEIKEKLSQPSYGSEEWWKLSDRKASEDIQTGKYEIFDNADDLIKDLHKNLK